jgi:hypothetical protein
MSAPQGTPFLVTCPACNAQISNQAPACPRCGQPISVISTPQAQTQLVKKQSPMFKGCLLLLGIPLLIGLLVLVFTIAGHESPQKRREREANEQAQQAERDKRAKQQAQEDKEQYCHRMVLWGYPGFTDHLPAIMDDNGKPNAEYKRRWNMCVRQSQGEIDFYIDTARKAGRIQ